MKATWSVHLLSATWILVLRLSLVWIGLCMASWWVCQVTVYEYQWNGSLMNYLVLMMSTGIDAMVVTSPLIILATKCSRMFSSKYPNRENESHEINEQNNAMDDIHTKGN